MNEIYVFKDWSAISQIKNHENPKRRAVASVCPQDGSVIISILEEDTILVRIPVDSNNMWSFSASEAEELLNAYGFNCQFDKTYTLSDNARNTLESLKKMGMTIITRFVRPKGQVLAAGGSSDTPIDLSTTVGYKYEDWLFLSPNLTYNIDTILK